MMLTGKVPFMAPTLPEIYEKIKVRGCVSCDSHVVALSPPYLPC